MYFLVKTGEGLEFTFKLMWGQMEAAHVYEEQKQKRVQRAKAIWNFKKSSGV